MRAKDEFYMLLAMFLSVFMFIFIGVECFSVSIFHVGFFLFGIPIISVSAMFWYEIIIKVFNL